MTRSAEQIFHEARGMPPAERAGYLQGACGADAALRAKVETLLKAEAEAGDFLRTSGESAPTSDSSAAVAATLAAPIREGPGTRIGPYKLLQLIGEGGFGSVFMAQQEQPVQRKVALKIIKLGMDTRQVVARFEQERQALAMMDHPHIARVLDAGATETGRPFFVMELVKGDPIVEYADKNNLSIEDRLELFAQVCNAVQHAHTKGIIHRDIKPSNILVSTQDGRPHCKVIDFGIAKATASKLTEKTLFTEHRQLIGTPEYMSPEQAEGNLDIDTRTDVYSLGVLLYELLTGTTPFSSNELRSAAYAEIQRIIREVEPPKPSTRLSSNTDTIASVAAKRHTEPKRLGAIVRGELDWIVMKAMEKDRQRRYETANGLAMDIRRYLSGEAVVAAPPGTAYRFRKFVRRHRGQMLAAGFVLAALLAGITGTSWGLIRARQANAELVRANTRVGERYNLAVDAIKTFHTGVSEDFLLKQDAFKELRDRLLKSASDFYGKLSAMLGAETDMDSRRALAQSNFELAELTGKVGRIEDALAAHRAVLAARRALATESAADAAVKTDVGRSLTALASALEAAGQTDEALASFRQSEALLAGLDAADPRVRAALGGCRLRMGWLLTKLGKSDDALVAYKLALADQEVSAGASETQDNVRRDEADALIRMGLLHSRTGKTSEAEADYRAALAIQKSLVDENPTAIGLRNSLAFSRNTLGALLLQTGRPADAEAEYLAAQSLYEKLARENPAVIDFRSRLGQSHHNLGSLYSSMGKLDESEREYRAAVGIRQKLAEENPAVTDFRGDLAHWRNNIGNLLLLMERPAEAVREHDAALAIRRRLADSEPGNPGWRRGVALSLTNLGALDTNAGRFDAAITRLRESAEIHERLTREHPQMTDYQSGLAFALTGLGRALHRAGRSADAVEPLRRAITLREAISALSLDARYDLACSHALLGVVTSDTYESDQAMAALRQAVAAGYRKLTNLRTDLDLEPLRARADFKAFVTEVEAERERQPGGKP